MHIGLDDTQDTISAGQANRDLGIETSWLTPAVVPSSSPGPCLLHYADSSCSSEKEYNHIIWTGRHQIIAPKIVSNTPELADDQEFRLLEGTYCATASCGCSLPKLSDAILKFYVFTPFYTFRTLKMTTVTRFEHLEPQN